MEPQRAPRPEPLSRQDLFQLLGAFGAVLTLATATMYYFGWRRSDIQAQAMEMDVSLFGFSTQDYVLRGLSSLYAPALVALALALGGFGIHRLVVRTLQSPQLSTVWRRRVIVALRGMSITAAVLATACVLFTWEASAAAPRWPVTPISRAIVDWRWAVPALLVLATLLGFYASWVRRQLLRNTRSARTSSVFCTVVVVAIVILGLLWMLEDYATKIGQRNAGLLAQHVMTLPQATVISPRALHIEADGVTEAPLEGDHFETTGLRLLARSGGKIVLLHDGWSPETGTVIVISDADELVWQFGRG